MIVYFNFSKRRDHKVHVSYIWQATPLLTLPCCPNRITEITCTNACDNIHERWQSIDRTINIYHWRIGQSNPWLLDQITRTVYLYITKYCTRAYCIQAALCYCISVILIMHRWCVWTISDNACPCPKAMQEVKQFIHNKSQSKADRRWRKCMAQTKAECAVANMQQNTRNVDQETNFCAWLEKILLQKHYLADLVDFGWS